jgi:hypothetical protein
VFMTKPQLIAALTLLGGCASREEPAVTCNVPAPIIFTSLRRYPLERSSSDSAEFRLAISGTRFAPATAHICVTNGRTILLHDSLPTVFWGPPVPDVDTDSAARAYAPHVFDGIAVFQSAALGPDPGVAYSALAQALSRERPPARVDLQEVAAAVQEWVDKGSTMLTYRTDPEGATTVVWWPSRGRFVRLEL